MSNKLRTITPDQLKEMAIDFINNHKSSDGTTIGVDIKDMCSHFSVSKSIARDVFIEAVNLGLRNVKLDAQKTKKPSSENGCINAKGVYIITKKVFTEFNNSLEDERKFKINDKFNLTLDGEKIVLERVEDES
ncbi:hypothetical protein [Solidesulfovibrio magneticus]|uniref:Uncharacterized protein n=1 Tax=Solidesulfovibrio magneticus (strain ATCC 700980 / DSM 13731 / RS-1) TaxID=573370 RepID=C4XIF8_SOLM1|nr:hypothetical protein [Solidesulfovibrio magneticus]BAH76533.1 hypothetical protein DMR_30420 [Solidesulfovibrio magneticus RS-1]